MKSAAIACVQFAPVTNQKQKNLDCMEQWICRIMKEHPDTDLIVFPELSVTGYDGTRREFWEMAETKEEGESIAVLGELAHKYKVYITCVLKRRGHYEQSIDRSQGREEILSGEEQKDPESVGRSFPRCV